MVEADVEFEEKKRLPLGWILGGAALVLLMGSCAFAMTSLFANIAVVQPISETFLNRTLDDGIPIAGDEIYSGKVDFEQTAIDSVNEMITTLGEPSSVGVPSCNASSQLGTETNGSFVVCTTQIEYAVSPATVTITWSKERDTWRVYGYHFNVADTEAYSDLVAKQQTASAEDSSSNKGKPSKGD